MDWGVVYLYWEQLLAINSISFFFSRRRYPQENLGLSRWGLLIDKDACRVDGRWTDIQISRGTTCLSERPLNRSSVRHKRGNMGRTCDRDGASRASQSETRDSYPSACRNRYPRQRPLSCSWSERHPVCLLPQVRLPAETGATSCDNQDSTTFNKRRPCFPYARDFLSGATQFPFLCFSFLFSPASCRNCIRHIVHSSGIKEGRVLSAPSQNPVGLATQVTRAPPDPEAPRSPPAPSAQRPSGQAQHCTSPTHGRRPVPCFSVHLPASLLTRILSFLPMHLAPTIIIV